MCLRYQSDTFPFSEQSNLDISLINSGFNNFLFSKEANIFQVKIETHFLQSVTL